jgi:hypothetical protein
MFNPGAFGKKQELLLIESGVQTAIAVSAHPAAIA